MSDNHEQEWVEKLPERPFDLTKELARWREMDRATTVVAVGGRVAVNGKLRWVLASKTKRGLNDQSYRHGLAVHPVRAGCFPWPAWPARCSNRALGPASIHRHGPAGRA